MACFENLIGLRELCDTTPSTSGRYLNDINISKSEIEGLITKDYASIQDFIDSKLSQAVFSTQSYIISTIQPFFKANSILSGSRIGHYDVNKQVVAQSGNTGMTIKVNNSRSYLNFNIASISLFCNYSGTVNILLYDIVQGKLLGTYPITSVAGQIVTINPSIKIESNKKCLELWLGYDSTTNNISSYKTDSHANCSTCIGTTFNNRYIQAHGGSIVTPFLSDNVTQLSHTSGLSVEYNVSCNQQSWLCMYEQSLVEPIIYKLGAEIMSHGLFASQTQRSNSYVSLSREILKEKYDFYHYNFERSIKTFLRSMSVPEDNDCFNCNSRIHSALTLP
jgi:hypothetical protein